MNNSKCFVHLLISLQVVDMASPTQTEVSKNFFEIYNNILVVDFFSITAFLADNKVDWFNLYWDNILISNMILLILISNIVYINFSGCTLRSVLVVG